MKDYTKESITLDFNARQVAPVPNLNGNSKRSLQEEWHEFIQALGTAWTKFPNESFHGRNHHFRDEENQEAARICRLEMNKALLALTQLATNIQEEVNKQ